MGTLTTLLSTTPRYAQLLRSQYWSTEDLLAYQKNRLEKTLEAALRIPFYAARFEGRPGPEDLKNLPTFPRSDSHKLNQSVRSLFPPETHFISDNSSGSTGMRAEFLFDASHQRSRFAARARYLRENGWSPIRRNGWIIYLPDCAADTELINCKLFIGTRVLSIFADFKEQASWLRRLDPLYLYTFPSNLDPLLDIFEATGEKLPSLKRIFSGAEVLEDSLRQRVRRMLGVEMVDNYGSTEAFMAWQCPEGSYHVNAEHVLVEILHDDGKPAAPGEMGRVVLTTLENYLMPLVRYEIGDYAIAATGRCQCGRTLPLISRLEGRNINLFRTADNRLVSPYEVILRLKSRPELKQIQIVQKAIDRYILRCVPSGPLTKEDMLNIQQCFNGVLRSHVTLEVQQVENIPRLPSGKFMLAISELA
jgi:phenylacetate-CoA ligase